jgi:hypothetical protein
LYDTSPLFDCSMQTAWIVGILHSCYAFILVSGTLSFHVSFTFCPRLSAPCVDLISGGQTSKYMIANHHMMARKHQVVDLVGVLEAEELVHKYQQATMKLDRFHTNTTCSSLEVQEECIALSNARQPRRPGRMRSK